MGCPRSGPANVASQIVGAERNHKHYFNERGTFPLKTRMTFIFRAIMDYVCRSSSRDDVLKHDTVSPIEKKKAYLVTGAEGISAHSNASTQKRSEQAFFKLDYHTEA